jgi:phytoene synthase
VTKRETAQAITRASKSNLALAFFSLPRVRREDITSFYAFCRLVDDIADSGDIAIEEKRQRLDKWKKAVEIQSAGEPELASEVRRLAVRYDIPRGYFHEIIAGLEMDLAPQTYETFNDLRLYCYRVASVVGLVSIQIFGYSHPRCKRYAVELGLALQLTNIIRDVGQDLSCGRVYLPVEDMARFDYSAGDLSRRVYDERFLALMNFESDRALNFYSEAAAALPAEDRRSMMPAEIMKNVYRRLLEVMRRDGFRVLEKRYCLNRLQKAGAITRALAGHLLDYGSTRMR